MSDLNKMINKLAELRELSLNIKNDPALVLTVEAELQRLIDKVAKSNAATLCTKDVDELTETGEQS